MSKFFTIYIFNIYLWAKPHYWFLPTPVLSIFIAMLTVWPNRQYLGMVTPTTPATTGPRKKCVFKIQMTFICMFVHSFLRSFFHSFARQSISLHSFEFIHHSSPTYLYVFQFVTEVVPLDDGVYGKQSCGSVNLKPCCQSPRHVSCHSVQGSRWPPYMRHQ